jgi:hypothetical protein
MNNLLCCYYTSFPFFIIIPLLYRFRPFPGPLSPFLRCVRVQPPSSPPPPPHSQYPSRAAAARREAPTPVPRHHRFLRNNRNEVSHAAAACLCSRDRPTAAPLRGFSVRRSFPSWARSAAYGFLRSTRALEYIGV